MEPKEVKKELSEIKNWLEKEYLQIQSGRITPQIFDSVKINVYGAMSNLNHIASVTVEDLKTINIMPFDKMLINDIEKALRSEDFGLSISVGQDSIRCIMPPLTSERLILIKKLLSDKFEQSKHSLKQIRERVVNSLKTDAKNKIISEDEMYTKKEDLQTMIGDFQTEMQSMYKNKLEGLEE